MTFNTTVFHVSMIQAHTYKIVTLSLYLLLYDFKLDFFFLVCVKLLIRKKVDFVFYR